MTTQSNPIAKWNEFWGTIKSDDFFGHADKSEYHQSLGETILYDVLHAPSGNLSSLYQYHFKHHHDEAKHLTDDQWEEFCSDYRIGLAEEFTKSTFECLEEWLVENNLEVKNEKI